VKGNQGAADNGTADNKNPVYKEIRPVKLDFSATNFKAKVTGWRLSIEKKANTLFPAVSDCARGIAGVAAASFATSTQSEYQDPQILARANLASEDEEDTAAEHEMDVVDERHDNGLGGDGADDGNNSGVDEDHNNWGDDGHDNGGDNGIGREEEEDDGNGGGVNENEEADDENSGDNCDKDHHDADSETEEEDSDLTEIGSDV
jgi:hypothetical protein